MKKYLFAAIICIFTASLFAIEVDIDEIKTKKVNFVNYTGKGSKSETVSEIKSIGYRLSYQVKKSKTDDLFRYHMKYSILRALAKDDKEKFSADILFIDKDARVDHIRNVRRIISAYLEGMYGYTTREADAVAVYTTYYNAVYRGNLDYFSSKYSTEVTKHLTKNNAGISTLWSDWPGKTAIVIPLTEENKRGEIGGIDPFVISDENVKEEVKKEKDNKTTTDEVIKIKEKEIGKNKKDIEEDKKIIEDKKKETQDEKKKIEIKKEETEKKKEEIKKEKEETAKIKDPEKRKVKEEEIKKKEDEVKKEEKKITETEKKIVKEEEKIKEDEKKIDKKEEEIKKKEDEVKKEKTDTVKEKTTGETKDNKNKKTETGKDENTSVKDEALKKKEETLKEKEKELDKREDKLKDKDSGEGVFGLKIYYLEVKDYLEGGHYNNTMYMINTTTKKIDFKSPVTNICGRRYDVFSGGIAVITHTGDHKAGHRLTLIDRETLKEIKTGEDNIFWRSFIEVKDNQIYAIIKDQETYYLGKFDMNLKLIAKSPEKINSNTFITFFEKSIYINREDKTIIVLKIEDLTLSDVIKP
jgi:hypothetical protein